MKNRIGKKSAIVAFCLISVVLVWIIYYRQPVYDKKPDARDKYSIIRDTHQHKITIAVTSTVDRDGLMRILAKAANEHQSYSERDYMFLGYLWVEAYLVDGNMQSKEPAGKLRRYVPPINGEGQLTLFDLFLSIVLPRNDSFSITLDEARASLTQAESSSKP